MFCSVKAYFDLELNLNSRLLCVNIRETNVLSLTDCQHQPELKIRAQPQSTKYTYSVYACIAFLCIFSVIPAGESIALIFTLFLSA